MAGLAVFALMLIFVLAHLLALCHEKEAVASVGAIDRFGSTSGDVVCDGKDAAKEMVKAGLARVSPEVPSSDDIVFIEEAARHARIGLWKNQSKR